ncbi:MAG: serine/threonine protein kinase [Myxococcales bacterium]|nr:serine/threonine protein kinase [Myxococcales bacterium]
MSEHANLIQTASMTGGSAAADALRVDGARDELSERVERYALLRKLGEGGMGVVYLAYDEMLDRRVAIKLIRERRIASADAQVRMIREAQALARLSHPNVVQVYDVGAHHDSVFVAMEYIEGNTLAEWLERRSLSGSRDANPSRAPSGPVAGDAPVQPPPRVRGDEREVIRRFAQAGRGLAAAHEAGLVHRDFKPANVLVGADGRARVVDFGLVTASVTSTGDYETSITQEDPGVSRTPSALAHELTEVGAVLGTPMYMAPEQFGARPTDARTDQFSFF